MEYHKFKKQLSNLFNNWGELSCHPKSDIFQAINKQVNSIISPNVLQLLNLAVSCLEENEIYCEIGTYPGATLISALVNNPDKIAYAVDDFSELDPKEDHFEKLSNNIEEFNIADQVLFCYQDAEEFFTEIKNQELTEKIGVYFYNSSQNYRSYLLGLLALKLIISTQALIIITNCQWTSCQQAIKDFLKISPEARLMIDFANADYLLWNGIQILTWDIQRLADKYLEKNITVDVQFQESINNITQGEINRYLSLMESKATLLFKNKKYSEAEKIYLHLIKLDKNNNNLWQNLGTIYYEQREYFKALDCVKRSLIIAPSEAINHYTAGLILERIDTNAAIEAYKKAIALNPELVDAYSNLANIYLIYNEINQAEEILKTLIANNPLHFSGYFNIGNLLLNFYQKIDEAINYYHTAFSLNPQYAEILKNLSFAYKLKDNQLEHLYYEGRYYFQQKEYQKAAKLYQQVIRIHSESINIYIHLLESLQALGKTQEAIEEFKLALEVSGDSLPLQIANLFVLPVIYQDIEEIEFYREYFHRRLNILTRYFSSDTLNTTIKSQNVVQAINVRTNFYLAYQGKNDVDFQKQYGEIVHKVMKANYPQWCQNLPSPQISPGEKIRVGYISTHLHNHSGANGCLGWVKNHNRQDFQIYCYHIGVKRDEITEQYKSYSYSFVHISNDIEAICTQITADKIHILVFPAIGMTALNGLIAALRLAPIQCMAWGHPVTSGLPTIDYFLSSELMEPENAQEHYSEKLIRLPNTSLCYVKPVLPGVKKTRSEFGIPEDCVLYLSCQSTFKYLPQHDYIFAEIAKEISNAKFVFIAAIEGQHITNIFRQRLQKAFAKLGLNSEDYCIILPRQISYEFLQLNQISDIYLDTFIWSGGFTTLNAISCNLPIVTCPGEFMRGRHSYAFLKILGITDTIAQSEAEYIEIAVRLGLDIDWRNSIIERTKENQHRVFDDKTSVEGLEAFYKQVAGKNSEKSNLI
ncbi:tetratricopeptide repeat protein [Anabaena azotica]|uniref:O-linked N-acetylglucosamine transferase family protein n=1 Tax=Anabaena azotica TaxID=197653 RepID=UPI0039A72F17